MMKQSTIRTLEELATDDICINAMLVQRSITGVPIDDDFLIDIIQALAVQKKAFFQRCVHLSQRECPTIEIHSR
jgi:hypothetical protein